MNRKGTGLVHIYFGDGKGKTTTGMGLCVRAAGYGYRVLIYQFMKNNKTSERNILEKIENVSIVNGLDQEKFSFQMTEQMTHRCPRCAAHSQTSLAQMSRRQM